MKTILFLLQKKIFNFKFENSAAKNLFIVALIFSSKIFFPITVKNKNYHLIKIHCNMEEYPPLFSFVK